MKTNELPPRGLDIVRKFRETLIYRPNGRLLVGFAHRDWRFASRLIIGTGAGYIGGFTAYFAFRSDSRDWWRNYRGERGSLFSRLTGIEAGVTRNANIVPYIHH